MNLKTGVQLVQVESKLSFFHRSRIDIIANVLYVSFDGAKKTHIMYKCNLSYKQLQIYLKLLDDRGLLKTIPEKNRNNTSLYETTLKGRAFLDAYTAIKGLLDVKRETDIIKAI